MPLPDKVNPRPARRGGSTIATLAVTFFSLLLTFPAAAAAGALALIEKAANGSAQQIDHSAWDELLKTYVKPGSDGLNRVDYAAFKASGQASLKTYIASLEKVDPAMLDRKGQFAFLANLYNAKTVDIILDHYPVSSIKDISLGGDIVATFTGGPWKAKVVTLKGEALSLDDIEHAMLRPTFKDPRIHYAVNCASVGCPNLQTEAFTAAKLEAQLDASARDYVNHPRGVRVDADGVHISSIYRWYKADFGGNDEGILAHVRKYADPDLAAYIKGATSIAGHDYDWTLNDIAR